MKYSQTNWAYHLIVWFIFAAFMLNTRIAQGQSVDDLLLLQANVNQVKKNDVRIWAETEQRIWIHQSDFELLKLTLSKTESRSIAGEPYVLLTSDGIQSKIDMDALALVIQASPELLGRQVIDLSARQNNPLTPQPWLTALNNYNFSLNAATKETTTWSGKTFSSVAVGSLVLQNTHAFSSNNGFTQKRESSQLLLDWPRAKIRFTGGDIMPTGGGFSRAGPMLGIQVSRRFALQPEYSASPTFQYLGSVDTPSTAELRVDGQLIRNFKVNPGTLDLRDFSYFGGLRNLSLTLTDVYGVEKTINLPFYFTEQNLNRGVHEFSYSIGRMRQTNSDPYAAWQYKDLGWSASHRIGLTSFLTLGVYGEKVPAHKLWGTRASLVLGRLGTLFAEGAWRKNINDTDTNPQRAYLLGYQISNGSFAFNASYLKQTDSFEGTRYQTDGTKISNLRDSLNIGLSTSIGSQHSLSLNLSRQHDTAGQKSTFASLSHRWRINSKLNLNSFVTQKRTTTEKSTSFGMQLTYQMGDNWNSNARYQNDDGTRKIGIQAQYAPNQGQNFSARISTERTTSKTQNSQWLDASAIYRSKYADWGIQARQSQNASQTKTSGHLDIAGGMTYLGGRLYASRPIGQGFAVVDAAGQPNVRVYQNNQLLGRTNHKGRLLVPSLTAYLGQQIRIDDRDIPLEIGLDQVQKYAVSRDGAGVLLKFEGKSTTAVSGILMANYQGQNLPLNNAFLTLKSDDSEQKTATGPDGDFYMDNIQTGVTYLLHASNKTLQCAAKFQLEQRNSALIDLGVLMCEKVTPYD